MIAPKSPRTVWRSRVFLAIATILLLAKPSPAQNRLTNDVPESPSELKRLSLEELMNVEITSVSKKQQKASEAAAAVHVITNDDIRRSGARSIPEALRLAPNLQVAQVSSREWAVSARGFNSGVGNKLLVMIDGRSVYTPLFSGVFWDVQDTLLEDLDRIEVISGPGATLWGANAVNGVINIITKSARDTQGGLITGGGGTEERAFGGVRYGGKLGENAYYRVYGKYFNRDSTVFPSGADASDAWEMGQGGFRIDWDVREGNSLTLQGDAYGGEADQLSPGDLKLHGGNFLTRWTRTFSDDANFQLQFYYDRTHRLIPTVGFEEDLDTYDIDAQFQSNVGERQNIVAGLGYRFTHDEIENSPVLAFYPTELDRQLVSSFVQDEISLIPDHLRLTLGTKLEWNEYTDVEVQPSVRVAWNNDGHLVWGAVSRAVRTPSRIDRHFFVPATPPFLLGGGAGFESEKLIAYELGYRVQAHEKVFIAVSTFFNDYDDIRSLRPGPPFTIANDVEGETYGAELELTYHPVDWWRLSAGYTVMEQDLRVKPGRVDFNRARGEISDPAHQVLFRSSFDLPHNIEFDAMFRYVDRLQNIAGGVIGTVPNYYSLDLRLGWRITEDLEVSIVGQNLLDKQHPESGFPTATRREIERGVYGKVTWRF